MTHVCCYFEVHQPVRLRRYQPFDVATDAPYFDDALNKEVMEKVAEKSYRPTFKLLHEMLQADERFCFALSLTGTWVEQAKHWTPDLLALVQNLVATGRCELLAETYYHSLAGLFDAREFREQVALHTKLMRETFGVTPTTFRNTELMYSNGIGDLIADMGYPLVLTEGADHILAGRTPNHVYQATNPKLKLLLKHYSLSDDVAFRFSAAHRAGQPLTADRFAHFIHGTAGEAECVNLFMDFETFGEHQWADTGIFEFLRALPAAIQAHPDFTFGTPAQVAASHPTRETISVEHTISWADLERDTSAWLGNDMQRAMANHVYALAERVRSANNPTLLHTWRLLQTSDHTYYASTKGWGDGDVHSYFSAYDRPHDAFVALSNVLGDFELHLPPATNEDPPPKSRRAALQSKHLHRAVSQPEEQHSLRGA